MIKIGSKKKRIKIKDIHDLTKLLRNIEGYISDKELFTLFDYSRNLSLDAPIIEIGSYKGKSTLALAIGAMQGKGNRVYAIDPHEDFIGINGGKYGSNDLESKLKAITKYGLGQRIYPICLNSEQVASVWNKEIALLWIDGDHSQKAVESDYLGFYKWVQKDGFVVFHDCNMETVASVILNFVEPDEDLILSCDLGNMKIYQKCN